MSGPTKTSTRDDDGWAPHTEHGRQVWRDVLLTIGRAPFFELGLNAIAAQAAENTSPMTSFQIVRDRARQAIARAKATATLDAEFAAGLIGAGWPRDLTAATGEDELLRVVTG